jgi:hypothetical protein
VCIYIYIYRQGEKEKERERWWVRRRSRFSLVGDHRSPAAAAAV